MHKYTCAVVSVLILCFFLVLGIFWEEQSAEQFWYFNFSLYLVVFWAEQSKKPPCIMGLPGVKNSIEPRVLDSKKLSRKISQDCS